MNRLENRMIEKVAVTKGLIGKAVRSRMNNIRRMPKPQARTMARATKEQLSGMSIQQRDMIKAISRRPKDQLIRNMQKGRQRGNPNIADNEAYLNKASYGIRQLLIKGRI